MTAFEWILIFATILAPILAVQAQKWLERGRERKQRREWVFKTLMATRAYPISQPHVEALNLIDIEFYNDKEIRDAWNAYLDHLRQIFEETEDNATSQLWQETRKNLFAEMMYKMGKSLRYHFNTTHIKRASYFPVGLGEMENDFQVIRKALIDVLNGRKHISMAVVDFPDMEDSDAQKMVYETMNQLLKEGKVPPDMIAKPENSDTV
ncbi:MAG TPA: DUF6680 family protein [Pyrinomonadaceae bacterium]|jgi:hypothetical protein